MPVGSVSPTLIPSLCCISSMTRSAPASAHDSVAAFSRVIAGLVELVFHLADSTVHPGVSRQLVAFVHLVQGKEAAGQLLLSANGERIHGLVQMVGPYNDRINLPLEGMVRGTAAQWVSSSPMGLTRSEVRLEQVFGRPVLRGTAWSNRNGKLREWTWEATYEKPLE